MCRSALHAGHCLVHGYTMEVVKQLLVIVACHLPACSSTDGCWVLHLAGSAGSWDAASIPD